jgi:uncharacterized iron-regulated membrane protein
MSLLGRFYRRPRQLPARRFNFQVHVWAGTIVALYMILMGVTGSVLVFREELEARSGRRPWQRIQLNPPFADPATVVRNLRTAFPRGRVISLLGPTDAEPTFVAVVQSRSRIKVACDAATGHVLGEFPKGAAWLRVVDELHASLLAQRTGRVLNGIGAAVLLLMCATGLVNWWPGVQNWRRGLKVDFRRRWRRINFDLHGAAGFWTIPILAFWGVSGIYFAWTGQVTRLVNRISPLVSSKPPVITVQPVGDVAEPDLDDLIRQARIVDPGAAWKGIAFPSGRRAPLEILMQRGKGTSREYEDTVYFDPYSGEHLATWKYGVNRSLGDWFIWAQVPVHFGTSWGLAFKIIWALAGLVLPLLAVTGLVMYWNRILRRKWAGLRNGGMTRRSVLQATGLLTLGAASRKTARPAARTYVVGSTATGVPFSFVDIKSNTLTGAMVDIVKAVAMDAGFPIELRSMSFAALIPSLTSKKIDIISAAMLKTPAREKIVDFSQPVYSYGAGLVVAAHDAKDYQRIEDLKGMTVGAQVGTRFVDQLQTAGAKEVKTYDTLMDMLRDLSVGRVGAAYGDAPILAYEVAQGKTHNARFVKPFKPPSVEQVCLVVRKGESELLGPINAAIGRLQTITIRAILERWSLS